MYQKICRCCGLGLAQSSATNPNVCRDCDHFTTDDSPMRAANAILEDLNAGKLAASLELQLAPSR